MDMKELMKLSLEEVDLILRDQLADYTEEEIEELRHWKAYLLNKEKNEQKNTPPAMKKCPRCEAPNNLKAGKCRFCGDDWAVNEERQRDEDAEFSNLIRNIIGCAGLIVGAVSTIYGYALNNDAGYRWDTFWETGNTDPGEPFIVAGIICMAVGVLALLPKILGNKK